MEELIILLCNFGYTKEESKEILNTYPLNTYKPETLKKRIEEINMYMEKLGYSRAELIKVTKSLPTIYGLSIDNIRQKIEDMEKLGYSKAEVIKMTKKLPSIYGLNMDNMKQKIEDVKKLGYSKEEVIRMTKNLPSIYSYSIDTLKQKIEDMEKLGYRKEEVIRMTKNLPSIYGFCIDNIKQKIDFYDSIGLHELAINDTKQLMQSVSLSYARYMFYKEKGIEITDKSYNKLFINQKQFEKAYRITKVELLEKYDYEAYIQQKKTQDLGKETLEIQKDTPYIQQTEHAMNNQEQMLEQKNQDGVNID